MLHRKNPCIFHLLSSAYAGICRTDLADLPHTPQLPSIPRHVPDATPVTVFFSKGIIIIYAFRLIANTAYVKMLLLLFASSITIPCLICPVMKKNYVWQTNASSRSSLLHIILLDVLDVFVSFKIFLMSEMTCFNQK